MLLLCLQFYTRFFDILKGAQTNLLKAEKKRCDPLNFKWGGVIAKSRNQQIWTVSVENKYFSC